MPDLRESYGEEERPARHEISTVSHHVKFLNPDFAALNPGYERKLGP
jgi:hypothetical protein